MDIQKVLSKTPCRVPYFSIKLPKEKITDLKVREKTTILLGLRYNYPLLSGVLYEKDKMATIVGKRLKNGFYEYDLVSK